MDENDMIYNISLINHFHINESILNKNITSKFFIKYSKTFYAFSFKKSLANKSIHYYIVLDSY